MHVDEGLVTSCDDGLRADASDIDVPPGFWPQSLECFGTEYYFRTCERSKDGDALWADYENPVTKQVFRVFND